MEKPLAKKVLFTVLSGVLAYNTFKLTAIFLVLPQEEFSTLAIVISALAFIFLITGVAAFLGFVYPTSRILPSDYYRIKNPKKLSFWYRYLGVKYFKTFLLYTFYRRKENLKYFDGTKSGIFLFEFNTRQSEFGHLAAFVLGFFISLLLLFEGHEKVFILMQPVNIFLNLYPILLQRKHRIVLERLISRTEGK